MPPFRRYSLHAALDAIRAECVRRLADEYPDQRIEMRPLGFEPLCLYQFWIDGKPFGTPLNLEDMVGESLQSGFETAVLAVVQPLSDELMMYLQTAA
jgi:hypothetical protein